MLQFDLFLKSILCGFQAEGLRLMLASIMFNYFFKFVGHWCINKVNISGITLQSLRYGTQQMLKHQSYIHKVEKPLTQNIHFE